jgi:hypothetical protein
LAVKFSGSCSDNNSGDLQIPRPPVAQLTSSGNSDSVVT